MAKTSTSTTVKVHLTKTEIRQDLYDRYLAAASQPDQEPERKTAPSDRLQRRELFVSASGGQVYKKA